MTPDSRLMPSKLGAVQPGDHLLHIYAAEGRLLDALEWYVGQAQQNDASVVLIATASHIHELEKRLRASWVPIDRMRWLGQYTTLIADQVLNEISSDGMPDTELFEATLAPVIARARQAGSGVYAFGEMVGLLMERDAAPAAIELERIWSRYCAKTGLSLLCSYEERTFGRGGIRCMESIGHEHTRTLTWHDGAAPGR